MIPKKERSLEKVYQRKPGASRKPADNRYDAEKMIKTADNLNALIALFGNQRGDGRKQNAKQAKINKSVSLTNKFELARTLYDVLSDNRVLGESKILKKF